MQQVILFAKNFFKHPMMLGSLIPSSRFVVARLMSRIDFQHAKVILEYGPGIGNISEALLADMLPNSRLILIEMNAEFASHLRTKFAHEERVTIVHGSAADVVMILKHLGLEYANYILSGIPFSTIPDEVRQSILENSKSVLGKNGHLLVYQFTRAVLPHLEAIFSSVHEGFELLNVLPARLFDCSPSLATNRQIRNGHKGRNHLGGERRTKGNQMFK